MNYQGVEPTELTIRGAKVQLGIASFAQRSTTTEPGKLGYDVVVHVHNLGGAPIEDVTTLGNVVLRIDEQGRILSDTPSTAIPFAQNSIAPGATRDVQTGTANDLSSPSRIFVEFITSDGQTAVLGYAP